MEEMIIRESKLTIKVLLKNFTRPNENALEVTPARIEFIFSTLRLKGVTEQ